MSYANGTAMQRRMQLFVTTLTDIMLAVRRISASSLAFLKKKFARRTFLMNTNLRAIIALFLLFHGTIV